MGVESSATASSQVPRSAHGAVVAPGWQSIADTPVGLAVFDRDVRYIAASRRWLEDNGLAGRDVVGKLHYDLFPDLPEKWKAVHRRALAGETVTAQDDCFERADGSRLWKNWECRPWYDASGAIGGIQMWAEDVTARVEAEELVRQRLLEISARQQAEVALREQLSSTARMLENTGALAKVGGWELDVRSMRLHWSRETCRIHEIDPPVTPPLADAINFYAPEARPVIESLVDAAIHDGTPYDVELPLITATGRPIWVRAQCAPEMEDGKVTLLRGAFHDITERKRLETEAAQANALLERMSELARIGGWELDVVTGQLTMSREAARIHEVDFESLPLSVSNGSDFYPPEAWQKVSSAVKEAIEHGTAYDFESPFITAKGRHIWVRVRAIAVQEHGRTIRLQGSFQDITEFKRAEQDKAQLEAQLAQAQKLESVGLLAGGVAHDFNNMLGVIMGSAELAITQVDKAQPLHEDLLEIQRAAARSADLTRQLLAFARQQTISPVVLDLNENVGGMLSMLQRLMGEDIALHWEPAAAVWPVMMDPSQMDQILTNLCVNARHAIANVGTVTIATANVVADAAFCAAHAEALSGGYVQLSVRDTGCGMDEATLNRIFEPFFSTKGVGEGTGLGLATVYGAVKQNRGFISVSSALDVGTTFEVFLPAHGEVPAPALSPEAAAPDLRGHETILLVEDEPALMQLVKRTLEALGYSVLAASRAADALRLATAHVGEIHLLLTDVVMPDMNGRALAAAALQMRPTLKTLFMSGYAADVLAVRGPLAPGVAFIEKPFASAVLAAKIRMVLDGA